jgi:hypothetical protein
MLEYAALALAIEKASDVILGFVKAISDVAEKGDKAKKYVQDVKEKERLKGLLCDIQRQRYSQAPLPWLLRLTYSERAKGRKQTIDNWRQVQESLAELSENVAKILEILEDEQGDFIIESREAYESLLFGMKDRAKLIEALRNMPPPKTEEDFEALLKIAEFYSTLTEHLKLADRALAAYLTDGKDISLSPYPSLLEGFFPDWEGKHFLENKKD